MENQSKAENKGNRENNDTTDTISTTHKTPTFVIDYWNNILDKSLKGFALGGITTYFFIGRFRVGAIFGFGICAGYFNSDLMKIFKFYSESYNLNKNLIKNTKNEDLI